MFELRTWNYFNSHIINHKKHIEYAMLLQNSIITMYPYKLINMFFIFNTYHDIVSPESIIVRMKQQK
jgi:hypothetical protein